MRADERLPWVNVAIAVAIVWAIPRAGDDLHVALAGGRDILAGRLGAPDDWSFTTGGRTWLDQNWGAHALLYLTHAAGGETGLLLLKAALCLGIGLGLIASCRARGVSGPVPLLVAAAILLAMRTYVDLRPNLFTLLALPVLAWLLTSDRRPAAPAALAALGLALWANLHAGFIFGLGMLALWTVCLLLSASRMHGVTYGLARCRPWFFATVAAVALAALANPYGVENLTHPFIVARSPVWQNVAEWAPIFADSRFAAHLSTWEPFAVLAVLVLALAVRIAATTAGRRHDSTAAGDQRLATVLFDAVLVATTLVMALRSRRFVPLALLAMAPPLAVQCAWLLRVLPRRAPAIISLVLLAPALMLGYGLAMRYRPDNPLFPPESLFRRMTGSRSFYSHAADFVTANRLAGRVYNAWGWEGYLRWKRVPLQLFVGARAQQVYDEETYSTFLRILAVHESPRVALAGLQVHLAIVPMNEEYAPFLSTLTRELGTPWVYVYADGQWAVVTDGGSHETATLVEAVVSGRAWYPDAFVAALSRAMYLASPAARADPKVVRAALVAVNEIRPAPHAYFVLGGLTMDETLGARASVAYLTAEAERLATMRTDEPLGVDVLYCRRVIASFLAGLHEASGRDEAARAAATAEHALEGQIDALVATWGYGET